MSANFYSLAFVSGNSMKNTVCNNGICIEQKSGYDIERYDIVVAKVKKQGAENSAGLFSYKKMIKRVIGLPGDTIDIHDGTVYVNGSGIEAYNYDTETTSDITYPLTLGEDEYFILGDNRSNSYDSRYFGCVKQDQIQGKIVKILYRGIAK
jgi:signal peptidase I